MNVIRRVSLTRPEEAGKSWPAIAMGFFVAFGGVLFGYVFFIRSEAWLFNNLLIPPLQTDMTLEPLLVFLP